MILQRRSVLDLLDNLSNRNRCLYYGLAFMWAVENMIWKRNFFQALRTWFVKESYIIVYCSVRSHVDIVFDIVKKLASTKRVVVALHHDIDPVLFTAIQNIVVVKTFSCHVFVLFRANIMITPACNLGVNSKPIGSKSVHLLHSMSSLDGTYMDHMFDGNDYIFCVGEYHIKEFKRLSKRHNLQGKVLIRGGYPKLDAQIIQTSAYNNIELKKDITVLYAPTLITPEFKNLSPFMNFSRKIIDILISNRINVIFRPHPASVHNKEFNLIKKICIDYKDNPFFKFDQSKNYMKSYATSDLLLTDFSGTAFTYAFTFLRPVVFFMPYSKAELGLLGIQFKDREKVGSLIRDIDNLPMVCLDLYKRKNYHHHRIEKYRNATIFHLGDSAEYFCNCLNNIETNEIQEGWEVL